jgi:hypothetical protein
MRFGQGPTSATRPIDARDLGARMSALSILKFVSLKYVHGEPGNTLCVFHGLGLVADVENRIERNCGVAPRKLIELTRYVDIVRAAT